MLFLIGALGEQEASCFKEGLSILAPDVILQACQKYRLDQPSEWPAGILDFRGWFGVIIAERTRFDGMEQERERERVAQHCTERLPQ